MARALVIISAVLVPFGSLGALEAPLIGEARARADDAGCDPPPELGPSEVTPSDRAMGVPRNAIVRIRYSPHYFAGAQVPTETITLAVAASAEAVPGSTQLAGDDTLYFVPSAPLAGSTRYVGEASGAVVPFDFTFTTGTLTDVARPDFADPQTSSDFALEASPADACAGVGARRVRITFPAAIDDGPSSSIEYWVYLTRAEGLAAPVLLTRIRDYGAALVTGGFILDEAQAGSTACVSVVAVDGLDRATEWSSPACVDPEGGVGFVGLCATSPARPDRSRRRSTAVVMLLVGTFLGMRRRRRALAGDALRTRLPASSPART